MEIVFDYVFIRAVETIDIFYWLFTAGKYWIRQLAADFGLKLNSEEGGFEYEGRMVVGQLPLSLVRLELECFNINSDQLLCPLL